MPLRLITAPSALPVTLGEAKAHLNLQATTTTDDTLLTGLITAATRRVESMHQRRYGTQTWEWVRNEWPDRIRFPVTPVQSVNFVKYVDANSVVQTMDPSLYIVRSSYATKEIVAAASYYWGWGPTGFFPAPLMPWPWPVLGPAAEPICIRFVCGYADTSVDPIPENVKLAIKMLVAFWYTHRESSTSETLNDIMKELLEDEEWS